MQKYFILSLLGSIAIIIFAVMNSTPVLVKFFFWKFEVSMALIIFLSAALGAIIAALLGAVKQFKTGKELKKFTHKNHELMIENQKLTSENEIMVKEKNNIIE